jgi:hypothetical protein
MGKFRQLLTILFVSAIVTTCALAQSNLTQVRDTIYNSDGSPFNGTVVITWVGFSTPTSGSVSPLSTSARIYNGALSVLLVPSTTAAAGSYYQVVYYSSDGTTTWSEQWSVPPSSNPLSVSGVRTSSGTGTGTGGGTGSSGGGTYATLPIAISQVTGLGADLNTIDNSIASLTTTVTGLSSTVTSLSNIVAALQSSGGGTPSGQINTAFVDGETPAGTLDGTNTVFALNQAPTPAGSLELYRNGLVQTSGVDYTIAGSQITFLSGAVPVTGDLLQAYYRVVGTSVMPVFADAEVPGGTANGTNLTFTLAFAPSPIVSLKLYKNGMLLQQHADYTVSGLTVTFSAAAAPSAGDQIVAYYRH